MSAQPDEREGLYEIWCIPSVQHLVRLQINIHLWGPAEFTKVFVAYHWRRMGLEKLVVVMYTKGRESKARACSGMSSQILTMFP